MNDLKLLEIKLTPNKMHSIITRTKLGIIYIKPTLDGV